MNITQKEIASAMRDERTRLVSYLESVPESAWDKQTLCEDWTVRDLVSHLIGNAADIAALNLDGIGSVEYNQRQIDERSGRSPAELLVEWAEQGPAFEALIEALDDEFWSSDYLEFGSIGEALQRLVEDIWVHAQDIRIPLGDAPSTGPGLDATLDCIARELPKRCARLAPSVGSLRLATGGTTRHVTVGSDGVALDVTGEPVAVAFAGTGRIRLDSAQADGEVSVTPSAPAGFADALNLYGP